jgi:diacylglycerol kinase (ATP)
LPTIYRNIHLIYNPAAGRLQRAGENPVHKAREALEEHGHGVTLAPTAAPGEASELAGAAARSGADLIMAAGGDGTINEVLNGVIHTGVPMAVLPLGTANVLATELGLDRATEKAAALTGELVPEKIAAGLLRTADDNSRYFLMMAGIGLDANIVVEVDLELKKRLGKIAYWIGGFGKLGETFPEFDVRIGEEKFNSSFTLAARVRNYGGDLEIAKSACLLDDYFEVVAFEGEDSFQYLKYFTGVLANLLDKMDGVTIRRATELELDSPRGGDVHIQVDGELVGKLPARLEIVPEALTLLMPAEFRTEFAPTDSRITEPSAT